MGYCRAAFRGAKFEATVSVIANPGATVTLGNGKYNFYCTCNSNGQGTMTVTRRGMYKVGTSVVAAYDADGNTAEININQNGLVFSVQKIMINLGTNKLEVSNEYKSNSLLPYWGSTSTKPSSNFSEYWLVYRSDRMPVSRLDGTIVYKGAGTQYQINTSKSAYGYLHSNISSGSIGYYGLFGVLTINGNNYYTAIITASGTAKTFSSADRTFTSSGTMTVPAGMHKLSLCVVGGGGGGGHNGHYSFAGNSSNRNISVGAGGGEGGAMVTSSLDVIPGQSISVVIGGGGAGGSSWWKQVVSDYVDVYNGAGGSNGGTTSVTVNGRTISANGGAGAGQVNVSNLTPLNGGSGGSGRGNGGDGGRGFYCQGSRTGDNVAGSGTATYHQGDAGNGGSGAAFDGTWYGGGGGGGGSDGHIQPSKGGSFYVYAICGDGGNRGGGKGGWNNASVSGTANTGGGGGGGGSSADYASSASSSGGNGGSGVAILKFAA